MFCRLLGVLFFFENPKRSKSEKVHRRESWWQHERRSFNKLFHSPRKLLEPWFRWWVSTVLSVPLLWTGDPLLCSSPCLPGSAQSNSRLNSALLWPEKGNKCETHKNTPQAFDLKRETQQGESVVSDALCGRKFFSTDTTEARRLDSSVLSENDRQNNFLHATMQKPWFLTKQKLPTKFFHKKTKHSHAYPRPFFEFLHPLEKLFRLFLQLWKLRLVSLKKCKETKWTSTVPIMIYTIGTRLAPFDHCPEDTSKCRQAWNAHLVKLTTIAGLIAPISKFSVAWKEGGGNKFHKETANDTHTYTLSLSLTHSHSLSHTHTLLSLSVKGKGTFFSVELSCSYSQSEASLRLFCSSSLSDSVEHFS